ncbi:hypothetical protein I6A60_01905 [Frankia sp. AgB1.9]|uniref:hypothetical protein n=1 Tax=unclassified Frankia TaxID=2632575 RepID=UPI001931421E|nr:MULTISPECIES: hypothetical protein [unclassified Frankia]MBL7494468.1 hypothetical protein [Frankia sp. AgW1.1]MBL7546640.1 hypothetical protein [Frankia sp. AgB1.9]MBL7618499.1 hypothetical protein [Frankia sp. AgB1.8]
MDRNENMISALRRERAAYAARGLTDRVAQVDEQLAHHGDAPEPAGDAPAGRQTPAAKQQKAAAPAKP